MDSMDTRKCAHKSHKRKCTSGSFKRCIIINLNSLVLNGFMLSVQLTEV